jgi:hypothetical protein
MEEDALHLLWFMALFSTIKFSSPLPLGNWWWSLSLISVGFYARLKF